MNTTTYDAKNKVAKIQPGSNWGQVCETLDQYGVAAIGGRASVVGVGGFTTGGGYSFHSNAKGFACDQIVDFEVVLANGKIVNANSKQNPDLWKSLKGGSANFGFVTSIDQCITSSNELWGGFVIFDLAQRDVVFNAYINANWTAEITKNDIRIMKFMEEKHEEYVNKMKAAVPGSEFGVLAQFQPVTVSMVRHGRENGGNVLGLEDVIADRPALMWLIAVTVDTAENQEKIHHLTLE
ncbi:hypothetical protein ACKRZS_007076 [Fusarium odoratissimum]